MPRPRAALAAAALAAVLAGTAAPAGAVPVGDGRVTTDGPLKGSVFACARPGTAQAATPPWIRRGAYDPRSKPRIDGHVEWPAASFLLTPAAGSVGFAGNGLPVGTPTGAFPPRAGDDAAPYAGDSPALARHDLAGAYPAAPAVRGQAACVDLATPVAVAVNGVPIAAPVGPGTLDARAREVQDSCGGSTAAGGLYRYRAAPTCLGRPSSPRGHSRLVGRARDGFGLYGPRGRGGRPVRNADLDACHGHRHSLVAGGRKRSVYHYHATAEFPYAIGCFRGTPATGWTLAPAGPAPAPADPPVAPQPPAGDPPAQQPAPEEPEPGAPTVSADPALFPAFDPDVSDYVTRCLPDEPLTLSVSTAPGGRVSIDGREARAGTFTATLGVDPGEEFTFASIGRRVTREYHVRCVPADLPRWTVARNGTPQAQFYIFTPRVLTAPGPYAVIVDNRGVPVWWYDGGSNEPMAAMPLPNGNLAWYTHFPIGPHYGTDPAIGFEEHKLDGSFVSLRRTVGAPTDPHELIPLPGGNVLMLAYKPRTGVDLSAHGGSSNATVVDALIQELNPAGDVVWDWNSKDHVAIEESAGWRDFINARGASVGEYDLVHANSLEPDGDGIVISMRHTDAVYRIDKATEAIDWKLGGTPTPQSLTVLGDAANAPRHLVAQHDARVLPDGSVTVFDNGAHPDIPRQPRAVRFGLDLDGSPRTATLLEAIDPPATVDSFCCGSARKIPGGNWVIAWGATDYATENAPSGAERLRLTLAPQHGFTYRFVPMLPGAFDIGALRAGMNARYPR